MEAEAEAFLLLLLASLAVSSTKTAQALALSYDTGRKLEAVGKQILGNSLISNSDFHFQLFFSSFIKIKEVF